MRKGGREGEGEEGGGGRGGRGREGREGGEGGREGGREAKLKTTSRVAVKIRFPFFPCTTIVLC